MSLLGADPRPYLAASDEAAARWIAMHVSSAPPDEQADEQAREALRRQVLTDPMTVALVERLPEWEIDVGLSSHGSPLFAPNLLGFLADMGVRGGDFPRIESLLDAMLRHQEPSGALASFGKLRALPQPVWGALACDTHAITEVLIRFGRGDDARVSAALERMAADLGDTSQGPGWRCLPHSNTGFRGPGRKSDICLQVTLEALRTFARVAPERRPATTLGAARTVLRAWRVRGQEKPYLFGHGRQFKTVKWPTCWYDIHWVLDTLGRYPELWRAPDVLADDRQALAELLACLVAYNFNSDGTVTPRSCYQGFAEFSFGQKKRPSPLATARLVTVLARFDDLAADIANVDVRALTSSKGGAGLALPPR